MQFREIAKKFLPKPKISLAAGVLKDVFPKITSLSYVVPSLTFQLGLGDNNTKTLKQ